jgi:excisionase family DNA binding protein
MNKEGRVAPRVWTYSVQEAGKMAGLGRNASYEAVKRGDIPVIRLGKLLRVPAAAWDRKLTGEA